METKTLPKVAMDGALKYLYAHPSFELFLAGQDAAGRRRHTSHWSPGLSGRLLLPAFSLYLPLRVVPASVVLFRLAESLHPIEVALLAGKGRSMLGDYVSTNL